LRRKLATHFFCVNNFAIFFSAAPTPSACDELASFRVDAQRRDGAFAKNA